MGVRNQSHQHEAGGETLSVAGGGGDDPGGSHGPAQPCEAL